MAELHPTGGIMVIGAHAGDAENMAAAVGPQAHQSWLPGHHPPPDAGRGGHPRMSPGTTPSSASAKWPESARLMGADAVWLPYPDGLLPVNDEVKFSRRRPDPRATPGRDPHPLARLDAQRPHRLPRHRAGRRVLCRAARHPRTDAGGNS